MLRVFLFLFFLSLPLQGPYAQERQAVSRTEDAAQHTWDFGKVKEGEVASHTFVLRNNSDKEVRINDVSSSCGCTASSVSTKIIFPGEEAKIEVKFNSKGYSGDVKQYVYVHTDDPVNPITRFIIKANVVK